MGPSNLEICEMKLEQLFFNFFKNFKQNPKNVGYKRQNQIKTRFSMPKGAKGNLLPQFLEKKNPTFKNFSSKNLPQNHLLQKKNTKSQTIQNNILKINRTKKSY